MKLSSIARPTATTTLAVGALVVALSGTAVAVTAQNGNKLIKKHTLSGNRLHNNTITGAQVKESTLGQVPSAASADHATSADSATTAQTANSANTASSATTADSASTATTATTAQHLTALNWVALPLSNGWTTYVSNSYGAPQYAIDHEGFVHFRGAIDGSAKTSGTFATLPTGFRPGSAHLWINVASTNNSSDPQRVAVQIDSNGNMVAFGTGGATFAFVSLEGAEFFAG
jgi:hypothetical protein